MIELIQPLKVAGYKIIIQKLTPFTCTNNNQLEGIIENLHFNSNKEEILRNKLNSKHVKPV